MSIQYWWESSRICNSNTQSLHIIENNKVLPLTVNIQIINKSKIHAQKLHLIRYLKINPFPLLYSITTSISMVSLANITLRNNNTILCLNLNTNPNINWKPSISNEDTEMMGLVIHTGESRRMLMKKEGPWTIIGVSWKI